MASSLISYLEKAQEGILFHEDFENDNFVNANSWISVQGGPRTTVDKAIAGIKSFDNTAPGLPYIKKTFSEPLGVGDGWMVSAWFYDDLAHDTEEGPYLKIKLNDGKFFQVGVRNLVSDTNYSSNDTDVYSEDVFVESAAPRTTGWKKFVIVANTDGNTYDIVITPLDGIPMIATSSTDGFSPDTYVTEIHICSNTEGGSGLSFGFFDEVFNFVSMHTIVSGLAGRAIRLVENSTTSTSIGPFSLAGTGELQYSTVGYKGKYPVHLTKFLVSQKVVDDSDPTENASKLSSATASFDFFPGDIWKYQEINFGRKVQAFQPRPTSLTRRNLSASGLSESFTFALKDQLTFGISALSRDFEVLARNWFEHARFGNQFTFLVDDSSDYAFGLVSETVVPVGFAIGSFSLKLNADSTLGTPFPFSPAYRFEVGKRYILRSADNTQKQILTLADKHDPETSISQLLFEERFTFMPQVGDLIFSEHLYPFMEMMDEQLGFDLDVSTVPLYSLNQTIRDYNNG